MLKPLIIERNKSRCSWSVCLYHEESKRRYWVDVSLNERYQDLEVEWNQYIFYNTDHEDMIRKEFQEDSDNFDEACSAATSALEAQGEIFLGEDGDWYLKGDWKGAATWNL
jgi:hypothetical protein